MTYQLVYIEWADSASSVSGGWIELDGLQGRCALVRSVGWLIQDTEECKVLLPHLTEDKKQGCGEMIIPASSVRSMVSLSVSASSDHLSSVLEQEYSEVSEAA
jgi:hypothetical protein